MTNVIAANFNKPDQPIKRMYPNSKMAKQYSLTHQGGYYIEHGSSTFVFEHEDEAQYFYNQNIKDKA